MGIESYERIKIRDLNEVGTTNLIKAIIRTAAEEGDTEFFKSEWCDELMKFSGFTERELKVLKRRIGRTEHRLNRNICVAVSGETKRKFKEYSRQEGISYCENLRNLILDYIERKEEENGEQNDIET